MPLKSIRLCFIGNMLGQNADYITTQGQIVADLFAQEGYQVTCVSSKINRGLRLLDIVKTLVTNYRIFDVVLLEVYSGLYFTIAYIVSWLCKILKLPVIMVLHGGNLPEFSQKYPRLTTKVLNRADSLVSPSKFLADKINLSDCEIKIIPNVIDLNDYPFRERSEILPKLIWMRSFHPTYNPEMAINVLAKLRETEPSATLTMAGADKGLENKIKLMVEEIGLADSVRFSGFLNLEKKLEEFSNADIYINTNRADNMPVSVIEARALGLPVVATNVGGLPYLIEHSENGLLVANEDVDAMVENIKLLLNDSKLTQKISRNGQNMTELSDWKSVLPKWEKLIEQVSINKHLRKNKGFTTNKNLSPESPQNKV